LLITVEIKKKYISMRRGVPYVSPGYKKWSMAQERYSGARS
jgi:hypothetical protein